MSDMKNFLLSLQVQVTGLQLQVEALTKMLGETQTPPQTPRPEFLEPGAPARVRSSTSHENIIVPSITEALAAAAPKLEALNLQELRDTYYALLGKEKGKKTIAGLSNKASIIEDIKKLREDPAYLAEKKAKAANPRVMTAEHKAKFLAAGAAAREAKKAARAV
jgi:hypothetical protein